MALSAAQATPQVYVGTGLSVTMAEKRPRFSWLIEADARELLYRPPVSRSDVGGGLPPYEWVVQRFVTGDYGGFLQARVGGTPSIALGGLVGVTHAYHRQWWGQPDGSHTAMSQATLEVGASWGKTTRGVHLGAMVAADTGDPTHSPLVGARGRVVWNRSQVSPLEFDLLVRGKFPTDLCILCWDFA